MSYEKTESVPSVTGAIPATDKTILVGVNIDSAELEMFKKLTGVDKNAIAILSAARQGAKVLQKINSALDKSINEGVAVE